MNTLRSNNPLRHLLLLGFAVLLMGVVGCGYWGPNLIRNFHNNPEAEVVAIADLDGDRLRPSRHPHAGRPAVGAGDD